MGLDPRKVRISSVMSTPLVTLKKDRSLGEALNLMTSNDIRRLVLLNDDGGIFGTVTRWAFTGDSRGTGLSLPVLQAEKGLLCPFCMTLVSDPKALSKHIDTVHIGAELAEGDFKMWGRKDRF